MEERVWRIRNRFKPKRKSMEAMSTRKNILKWMLALLSAALLPMQGQKQECYGNRDGLYDGNIRKTEWATGGSPTQSYVYTYDERGFLTESSYSEGNGSNAGRYTERQSYDKMGNILTQERYGSRGGGSYGLIDEVTFSYDGNRLLKAEDAAPAVTDAGVMDFEDGSDAPTEYTYDAKGRLTSDKNTGITGITYTPEGYPLVISYGNGNSTEYVYTADGRKLRATYRTVAENVSEPLSSVSQSTAKALVETVRDYAGDAVYENGELVRVLTPEGYVEKSGSGYAHYYYIRDYQGNVRVVADATGAVKEENGYYPFGMLHGGDGGIQPYKYNGKELDRMHGLEWYDYGARMYNGYRFTTPDPLSERYYSTSPYAYCLNNPVLHVDRDGRAVETVWDVASLAMGVSSFTENLRQGNIGAAVADGLGIIVDGFAVATPFVPGGAGAAIKAARTADKATDALRLESKVFDETKQSARFVGDVDGKLIDTHETPKGTYVHPNGAETDILGREHRNKIGGGRIESVGTSHTHNRGKNIDKDGKVHFFREDKAHVPTYEEIQNIKKGVAKKKEK